MFSMVPVFNDSGELQHLVHVARDITEIKRLEEELLQSNKMEAIGTLAGDIAHDFNNILAAILGFSELIRDNLENPILIKSFIKKVIKAENRAKELVNQILSFSQKKRIQISDLLQPQIIVKEVFNLLRASFPSTLELKDIIDPHCSMIMIDPTSFHQILMNLCTNAFQSLGNEQGVITVQLANRTLGAREIGGNQGISPGLLSSCLLKIQARVWNNQ